MSEICPNAHFDDTFKFLSHLQSKVDSNRDAIYLGMWHYLNFMYKDYIKINSKKDNKKKRKKVNSNVLKLPTVSSHIYNTNMFEIERQVACLNVFFVL